MSTVSLILPDLGEGLDQAEIVAWLVAVGEPVARDQAVVEVQTDKSIVELPAPTEGVVESLEVEVGDIVPVGQTLMTITASAGDTDTRELTSSPEKPRDAEPPEKSASSSSLKGTKDAQTGHPRSRRPMAAPSTRRIARERGIDLSSITGTGPGGRITREDVEQSAHTAGTSPSAPSDAAITRVPNARTVPLRGIRRRISETMTRAWQEIPHITDLRVVDASNFTAAHSTLAKRFEARGTRLTYLPLLVMMVARALRQHEQLNASIDPDAGEIRYHGSCNIGIATATEQGLMVPVIHDADQRSLDDIVDEIQKLATAARSGNATPAQLSGGTFTISNSGTYGSTLGTPIIRPPEVGILGVGAIHDDVLAVSGKATVRPVLPLSVSADHRLVDGDVLGAFISTIVDMIEDPVLLLTGAA